MKKCNIGDVEKADSNWSDAKPLDPPLRGMIMFHASVASSGNMYFTSSDDTDQWVAFSRYVNGQYQESQMMDQSINARFSAGHPTVAPDESYIIFDAIPAASSFRDLYISFQNPDSSWTQSVNMGDVINTDQNEIAPSLSSDGKYLFFTRGGGGGSNNVYWVETSIVENLRPTGSN